MDWITEFLINEGGVNQELLVILLGLPFVATIIGIARYYIGVKTFSLYSPIILTVSYYIFKINYQSDSIDPTVTEVDRIIAGMVLGVFYTIVILATTIITYRIFKKTRIQFFPKISLGLGVITPMLVITLAFLNQNNFVRAGDVSLISLILIALASEQFLNTYIKKKFKLSIKLSIETILLSLICYGLLVTEPIQNLLLTNPELVLLTVPANYIIGKFKGLRLTEMIRFRDILSKEKSTNESNISNK